MICSVESRTEGSSEGNNLQRFCLEVDDILWVGAVEVVDLHVHGYGQVLPHVVGVGAGPDLHLLQPIKGIVSPD